MNGVKETGKEGKIVMIGYDAGKQLKDAIRAGTVAARSARIRSASATSASRPR